MARDKQRNTAAEVLKRVEAKIAWLEEHPYVKLRIGDIYDEFSIFDWWPEYLSKSHLQKMRQFLREAIKLGYGGYVCFKVGATGCANGMWAHTELETDAGYSPNHCPCLYRSFTPAYTYWSVTNTAGEWEWAGQYPDGGTHNQHYADLKTIKQLEAYIDEHPECYRKGR